MNKLVDMIIDLEMAKRAAGFGGIETLTEVKCNRKNRITKEPCPWGRVEKFTKAVAMVAVNYEGTVNRALEAEGIQEKGEQLFESGSLPWGEWLTLPNGNKSKVIIAHKGEHYIRFIFSKKMMPSVTIKADGVEITKDQLAPYVAEKEGEMVVVRAYKASSIKRLAVGGQEYIFE